MNLFEVICTAGLLLVGIIAIRVAIHRSSEYQEKEKRHKEILSTLKTGRYCWNCGCSLIYPVKQEIGRRRIR